MTIHVPVSRVLALVCALSLLATASVSAQENQASDTDPAEQTGADTPVVEMSIGLAVASTDCYQLAGGGARCRGSLAGEASNGCGLSDGCHVNYGQLVFSVGAYLGRRFAIAGELAFGSQFELTPSEGTSSAAAGPRIKVWRAFGQVLVGRQWHEIFPSGLTVQPGAGIDFGSAMGVRLQADYSYFEPVPELSAFRLHVAFVAHLGKWAPRQLQRQSVLARVDR